ncbi:MAG: cell division protein FtsL [Rubrivivax sp. SCN 71-131]|jgi:cell division protein FtsL|nr:MAG: cell division protein FtsL [Rubrivivax sp. SCN 71-131]
MPAGKGLALLLLAALIGSALYLVNVSYEARRLFTLLDRAQAQARQLEGQARRLEAERQAQATHLRVERVARERLHMRGATAAVTQYVADVADAPVTPGATR